MRQRGFSLVEFMIAITIGLFLVAGLVYLIAETSRSRAEMERSSRQIENGRYALDRIAEDLRHAGFYSEFFRLPVVGEPGFPADLAASKPCAVDKADLEAGLPLGVQAYDGVAAWSSLPDEIKECLPEKDYLPDTDILVVRRASTTTTTKAAAAAAADLQKTQFIQTTPQEYRLNLGSQTADFTLTRPSANNTATVDVPLRRYVVRIYFVSKCNVPASGSECNGTSDDGGIPIPTLKMLELGPGPAFQKLALAEGIEHLQFDFGIDEQPPATNPTTGTPGDGVADRMSMCDAAGPCVPKDWSNVVSVQVHLVARNTERSPDYKDDKTYSLGLKGYTTATGDAYRRHAYSSFVRVKNLAMRRE